MFILFGTLWASWSWICFLPQVREYFSISSNKQDFCPFLSLFPFWDLSNASSLICRRFFLFFFLLLRLGEFHCCNFCLVLTFSISLFKFSPYSPSLIHPCTTLQRAARLEALQVTGNYLISKSFWYFLYWWYCWDVLQTIAARQTSIFYSCKNENGNFWQENPDTKICSFSFLPLWSLWKPVFMLISV